MANNSKKTIGLFIDNLYGMGSYQNEIWKGAIKGAEIENVNLITFTGGSIEKSPANKYEKYRNLVYSYATKENIDGLVIAGLSIGNHIPQNKFLEFLNKYKLPMVSIGAVPGCNCVTINNKSGLYEIIKHLIEKHNTKKIAFVHGPKENKDAIERFNIYKEILKQYNINFDENLIYYGNFLSDSGENAIKEFIDKRKIKIDAVVGSNDNMALGALNELKRRDIKVPNEIAVVGFDNIQEAASSFPSLTTVRQPIIEQGTAAVKMLMKLINQNKYEEVILDTQPLYRQSCGCSSERVSNAYFILEDKGERKDLKDLKDILFELNDAILFITKIDKNSNSIKLIKNFIDIFIEILLYDQKINLMQLLEEIIEQFIIENYNIELLQDIITEIRIKFIPYINNFGKYEIMDNYIQLSRLVIAERSFYFQADKRLSVEKESFYLDSISQALNSTFELEEILIILEKFIPVLMIKSCYISFFTDETQEKSKLIFSFYNGVRNQNKNEGNIYNTKQFLDNAHFQDNKFDIVIFPLYFKENNYGNLLIEVNSLNGLIYESIFAKLCSAFQGSIILQESNATQKILRNRNIEIQNFVEPMIISINKVTEICLDKMNIIKEITNITQKTSKDISETNNTIEKASKNINEMITLIKVIDDISAKINMVALNASIEASHAGEYGKGFSIIAGEIRKLSDSTKSHASSIYKTLNTIIINNKSSIDIVSKSQNSFNDLEKGVQGLLEALNLITENMNELSGKSKSLLSVMDKK